MAPKKKTFCPSFSFLFPPRKREKRSFQKLLSFVLSFFSWGAIISLLSSSSSREGKTSLRWKSTPPSRDDGNSSQATEDVSLLKSRFFFTRKRGDKWNALSIISKSTHPPTKRKWIDEASGVSSSSSSKRKIKKKNNNKEV